VKLSNPIDAGNKGNKPKHQRTQKKRTLTIQTPSHTPNIPQPHEKLTNLGSRGTPSLPTPALLKRSCMSNLLASSKPTFFLFIMRNTSFFPASSRPCLESPSTLPVRSKSLECKPASMSSRNEVGRRWYRGPGVRRGRRWIQRARVR
jgi:hypothetical protein